MITGRCMCGAVEYRTSVDMIWAAICHCRDCQRAASTDHVAWFGVAANETDLSGPLLKYSSSPGVTRSNCAICGTPMVFEAERFPNELHLYAPSLDDGTLYRPTDHIFWSERVPWCAVGDDLPKRPKGLKSDPVG